jgi:hypothetical protein
MVIKSSRLKAKGRTRRTKEEGRWTMREQTRSEPLETEKVRK